MSQKNDTPILIIALIVGLGVVGFGLWWFLNRGEAEILPSNPPTETPNAPVSLGPVEERLSLGERLLIEEGATPQKRSAVTQIARANWQGAIARKPSRSGIQETLLSSDFQVIGASGTLRFLPSGDRNQSLQLVEVQPGNNSGFGFDFLLLDE